MHKNVTDKRRVVLKQWCTSPAGIANWEDDRKSIASKKASCKPWTKKICDASASEKYCAHTHYMKKKKIYARCGIQRPFNVPGSGIALKMGMSLKVRSGFSYDNKVNKNFDWHTVVVSMSGAAYVTAAAAGMTLTALF